MGKKQIIDKIEKSELGVVADKKSLKALKFIKVDGGWAVTSSKKIKEIKELIIPAFYKRKPNRTQKLALFLFCLIIVKC